MDLLLEVMLSDVQLSVSDPEFFPMLGPEKLSGPLGFNLMGRGGGGGGGDGRGARAEGISAVQV